MPSVRPAASAHQRRRRVPSPGSVRIVVTAWLRRAGSAMLSRIAPPLAPSRDRGPHRAGEDAVPPPDRLEPLLGEDHVEGGPQPEEVMGRGGPAEELVVAPRRRPRPPVPVGARAAHPCGLGPRPVEGHREAGRRHQPLLAGRDHHVDAPGVHLEAVAGEARDRVDGEKRRMSGRVQRRPHRAHVVQDRRGGVGLHDEDRADRPVAVGRQPLGDARGIDRVLEAEVDDLGLHPHLPRRGRPSEPEAAGDEEERPVAGREQVRDRGLPGGMPVADVERDRGRRSAPRASGRRARSR